MENQNEENLQQQGRIIDEANYVPKQVAAPKGPAVVGRGGDPLFRNIRATREQLVELLEETTTVQDWVQRETCNNVALSCLDNENLKEIYFKIKDGFGDYGPIMLIGFKSPQGVEIPRLKIYDSDGEVLEVLTGPFAIDELNRRALAYQQAEQIVVFDDNPIINTEIEEYTGNLPEQ